MPISLDSLRAALQKNNKRETTGGEGSATYPFYKIDFDQTAVVRFLPDADSENPFFWVRKETIRLPFTGSVGGEHPIDGPAEVTVPCVDMWGVRCPILQEMRPFWKGGPEKEAIARTYWKRKSYIFQGFVVTSPFEEENVPENPIRRFAINQSIYQIIEQSLMNPEMENLPTDYIGGRDFRITKTKKDKWANYGTSSWSLRTRALSEVELAAIENYNLNNLKDFLGRQPDREELQAIVEMFHDSLNGEPFNVEKYAQWNYRAYPRRDYGDDAAPAAAPAQRAQQHTGFAQRAAAPAAAPASAPVDAAPAAAAAPASRPDAKAILDRIRAKTQGA